MVLETRIEAKIVAWVDKWSFNTAEKVARDTGKKINQDLKVKMELDIAKAQLKLKQLRKQLRSKDLTDAQRIRLTVETNAAQRNITEMKRSLNNLLNTWSKTTSRLQAKFSSLKWSILNAANAAKIFIAAMALRGVARAWSAIIKLAWDLEQAKISFTTMLWSADEANKLLTDLSNFAKETPFELTWIRQNAKQLLAMGIATDDLLPTLKALWDVSAWLSVPLDRLALAYGQVMAKGKLQWWELKQFTEAGVPLIETLSTKLWVSTKEFYNLVSAGQISAWQVTEAFTIMTSEWWKFANLMEAQSQTLQGQWSNLIDSVSLLWEKIGTSLLPAMKSFTELLNSIAWWSTQSLTAQLVGLKWEASSSAIKIDELTNKIKDLESWSLTLWDRLKAIFWVSVEAQIKKLNQELSWTQEELLWVNWEIDKLEWSTQLYEETLANLNSEIDNQKQALSDWVISQEEYQSAMYSIKQEIKETKLEALDYKGVIWDLNKQRVDTKASRQQFNLEKQEVIKDLKAIVALAEARAATADNIDDKIKYTDAAIAAQKALNNVMKQWITLEQSWWWWWSGWSKRKTTELTKATKELEKVTKDAIKKTWKAYDDLTKKIKKSQDAQKSLKDEITWIEWDIANRVVSIDVEVSDLEKKKSDETDYTTKQEIQSEIDTLNAERQQAFEWIRNEIEKDPISLFKKLDDAEQADILAKVWEIRQQTWQEPIDIIWDILTDKKTQELQDQIDKAAEYEKMTEIEKLQALKTEKENALAAELDNETALKEELKALEDKYMEYLQSNVQKELWWAAQLEAARKRVAAQKAKAWGGWWGWVWFKAAWWPITAGSPYVVWERWPELIIPQTNWQVVPNHNLTINQSVNANVSNDMDLDNLANALARKITLAGKWIR